MIKTFTQLLIFLSLFQIACKDSGPKNQDHVSWADTVAERTLNIMSGAEPARSISYLDSSYAAGPPPGIGDLWKKYQVKVSYYTFYDRDLNQRHVYVDSMLTVLKNFNSKYKYQYANTLFELAGLLQDEKKYNRAFQVYFQGRNFAKGNVDNCSMSEFSNALGIIRYRQEHFKEAIPFFKEALQEIQLCKRPTFQYEFIQPQSVLNSIALCFERSGEPDSAVHYYHEALRFISSAGSKYPVKKDFVTTARAVVEGNLGGVYAKIHQFQEAEKHLLINIELNDRPGFSIEDSQTAKIKLAELYIGFKLHDRAKLLLDQLEQDLNSGRGKSSSHEEIREKWYMLKSAYYDGTGNIVKAYQFSTKYHAFKDSLDRIQNELKKVDLDQVLNEQEQKYKVSLLEKENELKSNSMVALSVLLGMSLIFGLVIWYFYARSRKHVKNLQALNNQMQQALAALENSQRENARLMKIVAHDLRNPIGAISSVADIMLQDSYRSEEDSEFLRMIRDSGTNSLGLISNLLYMDTGFEMGLRKENVEFSELVKYCADMLVSKALDKQQQIHLNLMPVVLQLDYEKMWRVISNLISNAIKFSPIGKNIYIGMAVEDTVVLLTIRDEGIGISEELGDKIFDPFTDAKRKGTLGEESFGLGLSITKQIVEAHKGGISFLSTPGKGTEFMIRIPRGTAE